MHHDRPEKATAAAWKKNETNPISFASASHQLCISFAIVVE
jgi:hypothetical protein